MLNLNFRVILLAHYYMIQEKLQKEGWTKLLTKEENFIFKLVLRHTARM